MAATPSSAVQPLPPLALIPRCRGRARSRQPRAQNNRARTRAGDGRARSRPRRPRPTAREPWRAPTARDPDEGASGSAAHHLTDRHKSEKSCAAVGLRSWGGQGAVRAWGCETKPVPRGFPRPALSGSMGSAASTNTAGSPISATWCCWRGWWPGCCCARRSVSIAGRPCCHWTIQALLAWMPIPLRQLEPCIPSRGVRDRRPHPWFTFVELPLPLHQYTRLAVA